ncbi:MAG: formylglycine-generating enzyme family protein [Gemmataceae bacterium]
MIDPGLEHIISAEPWDPTLWMAAADWFEENGQPQGELIRLSILLRMNLSGEKKRKAEQRQWEIIRSGVIPWMPGLTNHVGMEFVLIPPGRFLMGSPFSEGYHSPDEGPVHEVEISEPFWLGRFPVTQGQYEKVMNCNPSHFSENGRLPYYRISEMNTAFFPVDSVPFQDAEKFCICLNNSPEEISLGRRYRLPTEAEWEYACRAGTSTTFYCGDSLDGYQANFDGTYPYGGDATRKRYLKRTSEIGSYPPNPFSLYDLYGNVWEWCSDWFDEMYYQESPMLDPTGPNNGEAHVLRGGSWIDAGWHCRSADRSHREALHYVGFRVAMTLKSWK